ncbi:hypothetical protein BH23DEI1_BH23DEI1_18100 [soil metagenome]
MTRGASRRRSGGGAGNEGADAHQGSIGEALDATTLRGPLAAGLLGTTGRLSGQQVLGFVKGWMRDGTIVLAQRDDVGGVPIVRGAAIMLVADGEVAARHMLGRFAGLAATGLSVHAHPHESTATPQLAAFSADAALSALRALPLVTAPQALVPGATELKTLLPKLRSAHWSGALVGEHETTSALTVLVEGRVAVARANRSGATLERIDALRVLQRIAFETEGSFLTLVPLEGRTANALAGFILGVLHDGESDVHTGIRTDEHGYTYALRGETYLTVTGGVAGTAERYAALEDGAIPDLHLPDEPPGWETQRYVLTLRGRDALNPMTERWMRFRSAYGVPGQRLLEVLADGATLEHASSAIDTDLEELRPWLKRLEEEGLVRVGQ